MTDRGSHSLIHLEPQLQPPCTDPGRCSWGLGQDLARSFWGRANRTWKPWFVAIRLHRWVNSTTAPWFDKNNREPSLVSRASSGQESNVWIMWIFAPDIDSGSATHLHYDISNHTAMYKHQAFSHPEIEFRPSVFSNVQTSDEDSTTTILNLLEVYRDHVSWKKRLDHSSLLNHFQVGGSYIIYSQDRLSFGRQKTC